MEYEGFSAKLEILNIIQIRIPGKKHLWAETGPNWAAQEQTEMGFLTLGLAQWGGWMWARSSSGWAAAHAVVNGSQAGARSQ